MSEILDAVDPLLRVTPPTAAADEETPPTSILIPRDDGAEALAIALAAVHIIERERRWTDAIKFLGGWVVAACLVPPLIMAVHGLSNQRPPEDKIWIATIYSDGSAPNPASPVQDQSPSEREGTIKKFMYDYVSYRKSYTFTDLRYNYDWVRFTTAGPEQARYMKSINDDEDRPTETLGKDGERRVSKQFANRIGPDAFEVTYRQTSKGKDGLTKEETRRVRITYNISKDMPAEVAHRLDPLKVVVVGWDDNPTQFPSPGEAQ